MLLVQTLRLLHISFNYEQHCRLQCGGLFFAFLDRRKEKAQKVQVSEALVGEISLLRQSIVEIDHDGPHRPGMPGWLDNL
jgi:sulfite exporter TauE/SafE